MDISKVLQELGRMYLEIVQLREQLAEANAKVAKLSKKSE